MCSIHIFWVNGYIFIFLGTFTLVFLALIIYAYTFALLTSSSLMKFSILSETMSLDNDLDLKPGPNFDFSLDCVPEMDLDLDLSLDIDPTSSKLPLCLSSSLVSPSLKPITIGSGAFALSAAPNTPFTHGLWSGSFVGPCPCILEPLSTCLQSGYWSASTFHLTTSLAG